MNEVKHQDQAVGEVSTEQAKGFNLQGWTSCCSPFFVGIFAKCPASHRADTVTAPLKRAFSIGLRRVLYRVPLAAHRIFFADIYLGVPPCILAAMPFLPHFQLPKHSNQNCKMYFPSFFKGHLVYPSPWALSACLLFRDRFDALKCSSTPILNQVRIAMNKQNRWTVSDAWRISNENNGEQPARYSFVDFSNDIIFLKPGVWLLSISVTRSPFAPLISPPPPKKNHLQKLVPPSFPLCSFSQRPGQPHEVLMLTFCAYFCSVKPSNYKVV